MLEMRRESVVVQDWDLSCGAAALATILKYQHGDQVSERDVARGLIAREEYLADPELVRRRQGFSLLDLKRFTDQRGYRGIGLGRLTLDDLVSMAPVIVPVDLLGYDHFVIFRGLWKDRVLLADPAYGNRTLHVDRFRKAWHEWPEIGHVGFVVQDGNNEANPGQLSPEAADFLVLPGPRLDHRATADE